SGRRLHALPSCPSRRGGDGRSDRRTAVGRIRRSGKSPARAEGGAGVVSWSHAMTVLERAASAEVVDDIVLPFAVESLSVRGRLVRLGPAIDLMLKRHDYPAPVSKLVAEAATLAALLGSTLKTSGRFQLQTKSDGPVTMLLVDFDAPSHLRALARFDKGRLEAA